MPVTTSVREVETPQGLAAYCLVRYDTVAARAFVEDVYVSPAHRRAGLGRALLRHLAREAAAAGCTILALDTGSDNHAARRLYETSGFRTASLPGATHQRYALDLLFNVRNRLIAQSLSESALPDPFHWWCDAMRVLQTLLVHIFG